MSSGLRIFRVVRGAGVPEPLALVQSSKVVIRGLTSAYALNSFMICAFYYYITTRDMSRLVDYTVELDDQTEVVQSYSGVRGVMACVLQESLAGESEYVVNLTDGGGVRGGLLGWFQVANSAC